MATSGSVPMQRVPSAASTAGHRTSRTHKASRTQASKLSGPSSAQKKNDLRLSTAPSEVPDVSNVYMIGKAAAAPLSGDFMSGVPSSGAECYLSPPGSLSVSQGAFPSILPLADGLTFPEMLGLPQHIDPMSTQMQMEFEGYISPDSLSSDSSSSGSPPAGYQDQPWSTTLVTSPTETGLSSPEILTHDAR
jgi:hypothetical protein